MPTKKGNPTAEEREETGTDGKYPMATEKQCISAVKLRHHGKGIAAATVLHKAAGAAARHGWKG